MATGQAAQNKIESMPGIQSHKNIFCRTPVSGVNYLSEVEYYIIYLWVHEDWLRVQYIIYLHECSV